LAASLLVSRRVPPRRLPSFFTQPHTPPSPASQVFTSCAASSCHFMRRRSASGVIENFRVEAMDAHSSDGSSSSSRNLRHAHRHTDRHTDRHTLKPTSQSHSMTARFCDCARRFKRTSQFYMTVLFSSPNQRAANIQLSGRRSIAT
jgi:hypothetical protein